MDLVLHPRAAPGPVLQLWVGVFDISVAMPLRWLVDGAERKPVPLRELSAARPAPDMVEPDVRRCFTGVYEFRQEIESDTTYRVQVGAIGGDGTTWSDVLTIRTLPAMVPLNGADSSNVLLSSCFYQGRTVPGSPGTWSGTCRPFTDRT